MDWRPLLFDLQRATHRAERDLDEAARLDRARALIDAHYSEELDLERIARAACFSPHHFHRLFKRATGDTPHAYLTRRRIEAARELLLTTDLPITDVCLEVGFQSLGSFSTLFRRFSGHPPGRYRATVVEALQVPGPAPFLSPIPACFIRLFGASPDGEEQKRKIREAPPAGPR